VVTELHSLYLASDVRTLRSLRATREDPTDADDSDNFDRPEADTVANTDTATDFSTIDPGSSGGDGSGDKVSEGADARGIDTGSLDNDSESQDTGTSDSEGSQSGRSDTSTDTNSDTRQPRSGDEKSSKDSDVASAEGQETHTSSSVDLEEGQDSSGAVAAHGSRSAKDGRDSSGSSVSSDDNSGDGTDGVDSSGDGGGREGSGGSRDDGRQSRSGSTLREQLAADGYDPDAVTADSGDEDSGRDSEASGVAHRRAGAVTTLAETPEDEWWLTRKTDVKQCTKEVNPAGLADVIEKVEGHDLTAEECGHKCRVTQGCNAWFWCADDTLDCLDWQSNTTVGYQGCLLLTADLRPQPLIRKNDVKRPHAFFSYHVGYLKTNIYLRPPLVAVGAAVAGCEPRTPEGKQPWKHADWLSRMSIANKQDYARVHGYEFILEVVRDGRSKHDVVMSLMRKVAGSERVRYLLWMDAFALVTRSQQNFPFLGRYERLNKPIIMYGDTDMVAKGDVEGFEPGVMLLRNSNETRDWLEYVNATRFNDTFMDAGWSTIRNAHAEDSFRNAMAMVFRRDNQSVVYFETDFCFACFWKEAELEAPTMFVTHYSGVSHCNDFSLAKDDPAWPAFNDHFVHNYRLARCKHSELLQLSRPRYAVESLPEPPEKTHMQAHVIVPGAFNKLPSVTQCRRKCRTTKGCNAWLYCWRPDGCDDGHFYRPDWYPYMACELMSIPHNVPLDFDGRGPMFSSSSFGFLPKKFKPGKVYSPDELDRRERPMGQRPKSHPNVIIITAIPSDPCQFPIADYMNKLSIANKQDYAHRHSFELHFASEVIDPNVTAGNWNKETMIRKTLMETPRADAEWIMWVDIDTLFFDTAVLPGFGYYKGKDLVVWGQEKQLLEGNLNEGMNCGVLLIRNSMWSADFFADVGQYAYTPIDVLQKTMRPVLEQEVFPLLSGFYDTPFIVWLLKTEPEYHKMLFMEDEISLNRHWLQFEYGTEEVATLITHYAGCTICKPPENKLDSTLIDACSFEFFKAFIYSRCNLLATWLGTRPCVYENSPDLKKLSIRLGQ